MYIVYAAVIVLRIAIVYEAAEYFLGVVETVSVWSVGDKRGKKAIFYRFSSGKI